jgi:hypothetical protein
MKAIILQIVDLNELFSIWKIIIAFTQVPTLIYCRVNEDFIFKMIVQEKRVSHTPVKLSFSRSLI